MEDRQALLLDRPVWDETEMRMLDAAVELIAVRGSGPQEIDTISGLQHGLLLARTPTPDKTEMAAVRTGHHLKDGAGFAMPSRAKDDSFVAPFHRRSLSWLRSLNQEQPGALARIPGFHEQSRPTGRCRQLCGNSSPISR